MTWQIVDIVDDLPKHPTKTYTKRPLSSIDTIAIHHSAGAGTSRATIDAIARYHVNNNDWPGIGYHYCITGDGSIYQTNFLDTLSYHAGGHNGHTVGVCLLGNFTDHEPTEEQLQAGAWFTSWLQNELGRALAIVPHRQLSETACPGATWEDWFDRLTHQ